MVVWNAHPLSDVLRTSRRAYVGGQDEVDLLVLEVVGDDGSRLEIGVLAVEILQNGLLVDVDRDHPVAVQPEMLAHDLGGLGLAGLEHAVLPGVSEVGDDQRDRPRSEPADGVLQEEHLDQIVIGIRVLDYDDVVMKRLGVYPGIAFAVGELG